MNEAAILCAELRRALGVHIRAPEMDRALATAGLTLTGGARQAAEAHLEGVRRLGEVALRDRVTGAPG